jgi:hypothetical protein
MGILKVGGVDPAVIRELSGIYKPFVKASKEFVSNAYDADADFVHIKLTEDFTEMEIIDDGLGMTPFEFHDDFTKVGGSYKRLQGGWTEKGRPKIGSKGIGFLAVARYCSGIEIVSTTTRSYDGTVQCHPNGKKIDLSSYLQVPIARDLLINRISISSIKLISNKRSKKLSKKDYYADSDGIINLKEPFSRSMWSAVEVKYSIDCQGLEFRAVIDFDYLLSLENKKDLEEITDFCTIEVYAPPDNDPRIKQHYTKIKLVKLKDFVIRDLATPHKIGYVRNVESRSGVERFLWHLQRCIPAKYDLPAPIREKYGEDNLESLDIKYIDRLVFSRPSYQDVELKRPLWGRELDPVLPIDDDISVEINIESDGLIARGYLLGHTEVIHPAEYRGIAVRVRNVQIGSPHFFGIEHIVTGPAKTTLSQITGEINVLKGMDAIDALNPGRESFYEENLHFKLLRKYIVGESEVVGGLLGRVIGGILTRSQVINAVDSQIARANQRRNALINLSLAINHYATGGKDGDSLRKLFGATSISANGLAERPNYGIYPESRICGFRVKNKQNIEDDHFTDFAGQTVYLNPNHDRWSWRIFVLGEFYEVIPKNGAEFDPLCQIDTADKKIYINWGHPIRQQMGDAAFLKTSVAWTVAYHASQGQVETMMDLALRLFTFNGA